MPAAETAPAAPTPPDRPSPETLHRQALDWLRRRRWDEAAACLRQLLALRPEEAEALNHLGVALSEQGQYAEALDCFDRALRGQPAFPQAHHNRGNALRKLGRHAAAAAACEEALRLDPEAADVCNNLGITLLALGRQADAAVRFRQALRLRPDHPDAANNLGVALSEQGHLTEAVAIYRQVLRRRPQAAESHNNLGIALAAQGRFAEAIACYRRALKLKPDYADAHNNLGNSLRQEGQVAEAAAALEQALRLKPDYAEAHNNLAIVRMRQGRIEQALEGYAEAVRLKPEYAEAHCNRALAWLLQGNFEQGWPEYESRWGTKDFKPRDFQQPRWDGTPLEGRTILLWCEQGLGDTLQFVRYAALVRQRGGVVLLEAPPRLLPLLKSCPGIDRLLPAGGPLPDFEVQAPLLSLPGLLRTTLETIPAPVPYLSPEPQRLRRWGEELRAIPGFKIGIAWQGSPTYGGDRHRSIPLKHFEPLARLPGVRLVSLQKKAGREQLAAVAGDWGVLDLAPRLDEDGGAFLDTAAVLPHLDLLVCSDSAVVHLAGALGVAAWVALPVARDWRWLRERSDCPWYPSLRLFRQRRWGDWDEVFRRIAAEVSQRQKAAQHRPLPVEVTAGELLARIAALEVRRRQAASGAEAAQVSVALGRLIAARAAVCTARRSWPGTSTGATGSAYHETDCLSLLAGPRGHGGHQDGLPPGGGVAGGRLRGLRGDRRRGGAGLVRDDGAGADAGRRGGGAGRAGLPGEPCGSAAGVRGLAQPQGGLLPESLHGLPRRGRPGGLQGLWSHRSPVPDLSGGGVLPASLPQLEYLRGAHGHRPGIVPAAAAQAAADRLRPAEAAPGDGLHPRPVSGREPGLPRGRVGDADEEDGTASGGGAGGIGVVPVAVPLRGGGAVAAGGAGERLRDRGLHGSGTARLHDGGQRLLVRLTPVGSLFKIEAHLSSEAPRLFCRRGTMGPAARIGQPCRTASIS
jgi:tetratricopeptide (TPR) repeat protein